MYQRTIKKVDGEDKVFYLVPSPAYKNYKKQEGLARSRKLKIESLVMRNRQLEFNKIRIKKYLQINIDRIDNLITTISDGIKEQLHD